MGDGDGLGAGDETRGHRRIDADVAQRPAAAARVVADVDGVEQEEAEGALHVAQPADGAALHELAGAQPLRMVRDHESLGRELAALVAGGDQRVDLLGPERDRLLGQHVLAGLERLPRPFDVVVVRQRDIDRVDLGIVEQRLVTRVGARAVGRGQRLRLARRAAGDGGDDAAVARVDARADPFARDLGRAEDAPPDLIHVRPSRF